MTPSSWRKQAPTQRSAATTVATTGWDDRVSVGGLDEPQFLQRSLERLRLAREALGPEVKLMMDAHGPLTVDRAVRLGEGAREYELTWFEEPVLSDDDLPGLAGPAVTAQGSCWTICTISSKVKARTDSPR